MFTVKLWTTAGEEVGVVKVATEHPKYVQWGGYTFTFNLANQRYEAFVPPLPLDLTPLQSSGPMSLFELRQYITDGIDRMLNRPIFLGLNEQAKLILKAQRDYWATNDQAVNDILTKLGWR